MVQYKGSPYYMQVENQSGNTRGRIIVVEKVEDPGNVNGMHSCNGSLMSWCISAGMYDKIIVACRVGRASSFRNTSLS